jgi:hypothetical protein
MTGSTVRRVLGIAALLLATSLIGSCGSDADRPVPAADRSTAVPSAPSTAPVEEPAESSLRSALSASAFRGNVAGVKSSGGDATIVLNVNTSLEDIDVVQGICDVATRVVAGAVSLQEVGAAGQIAC